jgi:site-specific DNA recombinase
MIRVAIYARFSSDLQNDKSVDDQIAFCREVCARNGMTVVLTFEDRAVSASSAKNRPGFIALMRAAAARLFDVVVAEDMDRIFRDQADYHAARKERDFLGITIHTATGKVTKIDGALRALMGEMYLENLALHVRRGLEGVIRDGRHAGGRAYGYSIVPGSPGELVIDDAQARIVQRIFARFVAGITPRAIAAELNADRIAAPRGTRWNASSNVRAALDWCFSPTAG